MATLRVTLLGGCECQIDGGTPVAFPTRKVRALFAFLATTVGQVHSRERVASLLWGDQSDEQARANLRSSLSRLRHVLPGDAGEVLCTTANALTLSSDGMTIDLVSFRQQLSAATPYSLEQAVALYGGAFLDGLEGCGEGFEEWLLVERRALEESFQHALQQLLDHYVVTGAIDRGIQIALRLVNIDPLQESLHRTLIRLYIYQDRLGAALEQYRRCRDLLSGELGIEPAPETEQLKAHILRQLPDHKALSGEPPAAEKDTLPEREHLFEAAVSYRLRQRSGMIGLPSIAILALRNEAPGAAPLHLRNGLAEDIAIELGRYRELEVIAPASAFAYRDTTAPPALAGQELGANFVLSGSLRVHTDGLRIAVRLIDTRSDTQIWAERYDCPLDDVFEMQDEVVQRIVSSLVGRIEVARLNQAKRKRPSEWEPYDLWLRGWDRLRQSDLSAIEDARHFFDQAIAFDPQFARPYVGQALAQLNEWACYSWNHWFFLKEDALNNAHKAVYLDDYDNRAHSILGIARIYAGDYEEATTSFLKALDLNPNDCDVLAHAAGALALIGDHETAVEAGRRALRLAPHHPEWYVVFVGTAFFASRNYEEAVQTISIAPEANCNISAVLAASYALMGMPERALHYKDTVYRHFRRMVDRGAYPSDRSCVDWLLDLDPYQRPEDARHYERGLRLAGFE
jgi:DNA-binding SARP family transcriptional activator/TolB-like protein